MLGSMLAATSNVFGRPYGVAGAAVTGVRAINPVVRGSAEADRPSAPTQQSATPLDKTRYSPATPQTRDTLYNRVGGLNAYGYQASSQSLSYSRQDTFDLSIQTADGDVATIHISQQQELDWSSGSASATGAAGAAQLQTWRGDSTDALDVNISVAGDLNAEEMASIDALVRKVNGVAQDFFSGDMAQASAAAQQISFGPEDSTLAAYQFSLQSQESLRAVAVYESVATSTATTTAPAISVAPPPARSAVDAAAVAPAPKSGLMQNLRAMLQDLTRNSQALTSTLQT